MATSDVMIPFKVQINKTSVVLLDINCICVNCYVWYISVNNLIFCIVWKVQQKIFSQKIWINFWKTKRFSYEFEIQFGDVLLHNTFHVLIFHDE
jgi:hypothetical protein